MADVGDILGEFELRREIGRGAMGVVWEAHQPSLDRTVALKVLKNTADDPTWRERFRSEAGQAAKLSHRGILPIYAFGETGDDSWYAMELIKGDDLDERVKREKQIPSRVAATWIRDAARALHHAHQHGVVHRDVKPANIMVQPDGRIVVMDFGLSKGFGSAGLTTTGMLIGSPYYMSPEMVSGQTEIGPPADVYALGVTLYELIDGKPPFLADSAVSLIRMIADVPPPPLRPRGSVVNNDLMELEAICHRAMSKQPEDRFANAADMADALDVVLGNASQAQPRTPAAAPPKRRRWVPLGVIGLVVLLGAVAAILAITATNQRDRIDSHDADMKSLEAKIAGLMEQGDLDGAQKALDEVTRGAAPSTSGALTQLQKMGGRVFLGQLTSTNAVGKRVRREIQDWPNQQAQLTLAVTPKDASIRGINLCDSLTITDVDAATTKWRAGIWRLIVQAPGRMPAVATVILRPNTRGTVTLALPVDAQEPSVLYPGVWVPIHNEASAPLASVVEPYVLTSSAVTHEAYAAFVAKAPGREQAGLALPDSPHNSAGRPARVSSKQAKAYVESLNSRLPLDFELNNAILPAFFAIMNKEAGREDNRRDKLRDVLSREGRRDFSADESHFWARTMAGFKAVGVPGFDGVKRRGRGRPRAARPAKGTTSEALILLVRSP